MVAAVWYQPMPVLIACLHLPVSGPSQCSLLRSLLLACSLVLGGGWCMQVAVFQRPNLEQRLKAAVEGLLSNYSMDLADVIRVRAWYDTTQVRGAGWWEIAGARLLPARS